MKRWTEAELRELEERYPNEDNGALAAHFGVSRKALVVRASSRGIHKNDAANMARYEAMARKKEPDVPGERHKCQTGTVIVNGGLTTHLSCFH